MEGEIKVITEEKEKQMSSDFKLLSESVDKLSKELVKVGSAVNNQKDSLEVERATVIKVSFFTHNSEVVVFLVHKWLQVRLNVTWFVTLY
jgi:hypothetical protein